MDFYVNQEKIDVVLENEKTVGDVLRAFEETASENDLATIGIVLNGKEISADGFEAACKIPLTPDLKLELTVISKIDIQHNFAVCGDNFKSISKKLENISVLMQNGKGNEANGIIKELSQYIDNFCHVATLSALFPDTYQNVIIEDQSIGDFFKDFAPILADFENALVSKDTVTVGDLAEYEIAPRLVQISIAIHKMLG